MVKIMIADDQQLIRESLKIILDSDPNFKVEKKLAVDKKYWIHWKQKV